MFIKGTKNIILPDVHIDDKGYYPVFNVVKKYIKDFQPDVTYLLGDFGDCCSFNPWNREKSRKRELKRHRAEIENIDEVLTFLEENSGKIVWLEGNHCNWAEQYIDRNPELEGLIEYPILLNLKKRGIQWVPREESRDYPTQPYKVGHLYLLHGLYTNEFHAKKHMMKFGCNVCYGHTHVSQEYTNNQVMQRTHKAKALACLCNKKASYLRGVEGSWNHEFAKLYVARNGEFNLYPVDVINNRFYIDGKSYK